MRTDLTLADLPLFVVILAIVLAQCVEPVDAPAQDRERVSAQLALARIAASECGFDCAEHEVAAIADVLRARAERLDCSFEDAARAYSSRVFDRARADVRAYVAHLQPGPREPAGWPETFTRTDRRTGAVRVLRHAPWSAYRDRWVELYARAGRVVRGEVASLCAEPVDHWGMRGGIDLERAQRAGWDEINCGETRNAFWRIPRASDADRD